MTRLRHPLSGDVEGTESFEYDAIGNLTKHTKPTGTTELTWNAYGKVSQVVKGDVTMTFGYDVQQNRLRKTVTANGETKTSYYIRDAQGNALAVYEQKGASLVWKEQDLYGSSRLGVAKPEREMTGFFWQSASYTLVAGAKSYELSNHLGNVLATISDRGELQSAQDYYPFGMSMPGRSSDAKHRYGFNGKETDPETGIQDYGMRWYLPNIARFLSVDPLFRKYPELTTYQFASNTPIQGSDLDGLEIIHHWEQQAEKYSGIRKVLIHAKEIFGQINSEFQKGNAGVDMYILAAYTSSAEGSTRFYEFKPLRPDPLDNRKEHRKALYRILFEQGSSMSEQERNDYVDFMMSNSFSAKDNKPIKKGIVLVRLSEYECLKIPNQEIKNLPT